MQNFRTEIKLNPAPFSIDYNQKIMMLGSCFTDNIGTILHDHGFRTLINPFGIAYNPHSIQECLEILMMNRKMEEKEFFLHEERYHHFSLHSDLSGISLEETVKNVNLSIEKGNLFLKEADILIITFGTAWIYEFTAEGRVVANCHKMPNHLFEKYKMGLGEIISDYSYLINRLKGFNPNLKIIFTISPVRHLKDGFIENSNSKSTLNLAIHELIRRFDNSVYFPAYEIMTDDLRDYRFYKNDMLHPTDLAVDYIFEKFREVFFKSETNGLFQRIAELKKAATHRPFNKDSEAHLKFIQEQLKKLEQISSENNIDNLNKIKDQFLTQLN